MNHLDMSQFSAKSIAVRLGRIAKVRFNILVVGER